MRGPQAEEGLLLWIASPGHRLGSPTRSFSGSGQAHQHNRVRAFVKHGSWSGQVFRISLHPSRAARRLCEAQTKA